MKPTKVAGTSVQIMLEKFCGPNDIVPHIANPPGYWAKKGYTKRNHDKGYNNHLPAFRVKSLLGESSFNQYYKFIVVRNPWDRAVSWFWWQYAGGSASERKYGGAKPRTQKNFAVVRNYFRTAVREGLKLASFRRWSHINDKSILDGFIRYERLETDSLKILHSVGISLVNQVFTYPKAKVSHRLCKEHYTEYYDSPTRKIIAKEYHNDINDYGYKFGN